MGLDPDTWLFLWSPRPLPLKQTVFSAFHPSPHSNPFFTTPFSIKVSPFSSLYACKDSGLFPLSPLNPPSPSVYTAWRANGVQGEEGAPKTDSCSVPAQVA